MKISVAMMKSVFLTDASIRLRIIEVSDFNSLLSDRSKVHGPVEA